MESNRNKRCRNLFSKSKLVMSIYKAMKPSNGKPPKPSPSDRSSEFGTNQPIKVKPTDSMPPGKPESSVGLMIMNQDRVFPQRASKVTVADVKDRDRESYCKMESFYSAYSEDEDVDDRVDKYISRVRETFKFQRVNSEGTN
ncbi:hypothetical protein OROHE_021718 [Orobanche hederae]